MLAEARRWLGAVGAAVWIAIGIDSIVGTDVAHYRDAVWSIPWVLTYLMFLAPAPGATRPHRPTRRHDLQGPHRRDGTHRAGSIGILFDIKALQFLGFPLGALIWVVVLVFFGLSTMKAGCCRSTPASC